MTRLKLQQSASFIVIAVSSGRKQPQMPSGRVEVECQQEYLFMHAYCILIYIY